ncbi:MAG: glycosyltransferase family 4 protein [Cyclobacteriaceae bacterium]
MKKILVVGITPPPYGGQAMMTERLIQARFEGLKLYLVRMAFSKSMSSVGNFELGKVFHMVEIVIKAAYFRFRYNIPTLYYMPGGSSFTPVARDIFILFFLRMLFSKTIFHFRAAGVSEIVDQQPALLRQLAKYVYRRPDLSIHLSDLNPDDGGYFNAKKIAIVPNGLEDGAQEHLPIQRTQKASVTILYVGVIQETKGVMVLLEAARMLKEQAIKVTLVGDFASQSFKDTVTTYCHDHGLENTVHFPGVKKGNEKWQYFLEADIFCFPSFFEAESFGNVVVEAMMFELPVVATRWRGIPSIVDDQETGLLVPVQDAALTANALNQLINDASLRMQLGKAGRKKYDAKYQVDAFICRMEQALSFEPSLSQES